MRRRFVVTGVGAAFRCFRPKYSKAKPQMVATKVRKLMVFS